MSKVLVFDPGHGGSDPGAIAIDGQEEKHFALALALATREAVVAAYDCTVIMTRESDVYVDLGERAMIANRAKANLFLSFHHNAGQPSARGGEVYVHTKRRSLTNPKELAWLPAVSSTGFVNHDAPNSYALAKAFVPAMRFELTRYAIPWRSMGDPGGIMCADFAVLRECEGPGILIETHFGTNEHDNWAARFPTFILDVAQAIAQGLAAALSLEPKAQGTPIIGEPLATLSQAQEWARSRKAHERFIAVAPVYWHFGRETGIRPDVLYAQAAKETAFGRYSGQVDPAQNNWAGVKVINATGDRPEDHETFATPEDGVRAHFNHMGAYVGLAPIGTPHARHRLVLGLAWAGTIRTVEELGARWAPNPDYGASIVRDYLAIMMATADPGQAPAVVAPPVEDSLNRLIGYGLIDSLPNAQSAITWEEFAGVVARMVERRHL